MKPPDSPWFAYIATLAIIVLVICGLNAVANSKYKPFDKIFQTPITNVICHECPDSRAEGYRAGFAEALMFKPHMSDKDRQFIIDSVLAYDGEIQG